MSISTSSILVDGTVATTGGTATTVITKGDTLNEHRVILDDSSEFAAQTEIRFAVKEPKVNSGAPNGYTQQRNIVSVLKPLALDNGNSTVNSAKVEIACDPETTDAEKLNLRVTLCQLIMDSDFVDFWDKQSLA